VLLTLRAAFAILLLTIPACTGDEVMPNHADSGTAMIDVEPVDDDGGAVMPTPVSCMPPEEQPSATATQLDCEVGVIDAITGLSFEVLKAGGTIPIGGTGQAGLTAKLAVRIADPSGVLADEQAIVAIVLSNTLNDETARSKPWGVPSPLECGSEAAICYALPVLVEISHLAKLPELEGLCVQVETEIIDSVDATTVLARCDNAGRLDRR